MPRAFSLRLAQRDIDALQFDVALGAVDERVVGRVERQAARRRARSAGSQAYGSCPVVAICSSVPSIAPTGVQLAGQAVDGAQVGREGVFAAERAVARLVGLPRSELSRTIRSCRRGSD